VSRYFIKFTRKRAWDILTQDWLKEGDVQCDPITDLRSNDGKLSIWEIMDDSSNLDFVILALACSRNKFEEVDYGLFDPSIVEGLGIPIEKSLGKTPVSKANIYHRDLVKLTVTMLARLVNQMFFNIDKDRRLDVEVKKLVLEAWERDVDPSKTTKEFKQLVEQELNTTTKVS